MPIVCLGLSHQSAPVETRELFALAEGALPGAVAQLVGAGAIQEAVIVSTCNRVECYAAVAEENEGRRVLEEFIAHGRIAPFFYLREVEAVTRHLFRVLCGLESMVLGETEILGQVKRAYQAAAVAGGTGRLLNPLFQRGFRVAKEVRTHTQITRGPVSVGSVAVELAQKIFGRLEPCRILILGAGEGSEQTARALLGRGARHVHVANRTGERASALAAEVNAEAMAWNDWPARIAEMDILIASTAAPGTIVAAADLQRAMRQRSERPLFVIDLAVPRDVEPAANEVEGVYLYDIDSLKAIAGSSLEVRRREMVHCEEIIERHVAELGARRERALPGESTEYVTALPS